MPGKVGRPKGSMDRAWKGRLWAKEMWEMQDCNQIVGRILKGSETIPKVRLLIQLLEYMYGKPVQPVEPTSDSGEVFSLGDGPKPNPTGNAEKYIQ